jgi:peptidoglycan-N-acetylmuramic acid deacetylase
MVNEGHVIGNHLWSHPDMTQISVSRMKEELAKVKNEVSNLTRQKEMRFVRPPKGIFSEQSLSFSGEFGYTTVFWSVAYMDWNTKHQKGWNYAYEKVMSQLHPGAVILLHSISKDNTEALGKIIDDARKRGYEFKNLEQLKVKHYS